MGALRSSLVVFERPSTRIRLCLCMTTRQIVPRRFSMRRSSLCLIGALLSLSCLPAYSPSPRFVAAQSPAEPLRPTAATPRDQSRLEVIEIFDAKYAGDTPGCVAVQKVTSPPRISLGDAVHRDGVTVGHLTAAAWNDETHVLRIEFDPSTGARTRISDVITLPTGAN